MSDLSRQARRAMRAKAHRLSEATTGKVDASDYGGEETLDAGVKTGMRPISRRAFKKGGKVVAVEGKDATKHAGRVQRKSGGVALVDDFVNRNVKDANEKREGIKHVGALKTGGRAKRASGGQMNADMGGNNFGVKGDSWDDVKTAAAIPKGGYDDPYEKTPPKLTAHQQSDMGRKRGGSAFEGTAKDKREDRVLAKKHHETFAKWEHSAADKKHDKQRSMKGLKSGGKAESVSDGTAEGTRPTGGRLARKDGGRAKGGTDINIIIGRPAQSAPAGGPPPMGAQGVPPGAMPPIPVGPPGLGAAGAPLPGGPVAGGPPPMAPPPPQMPIGRKRGGSVVGTFHEMKAGSGSAKGRLEKLGLEKD